ncbi:MAG: hypothetical protein IJ867_00485 [Clostridia bacterium]|nr:hypothetical protein [Clostridia bacterium]
MRQKSGKRAATKGNGAITGATKKTTAKNLKPKKFKNTRLFKILRITLLVLIIVLIFNIIKDLTRKAPEKVSVVIGDKQVQLSHEVLIDKYNNISMSIDDVKKLYDNNIYYSNNILITTYNKHIAVLEKGKNTMRVNDVVQEIKGKLKDVSGTMYLPFSDMADVYDFALSYNKDTKVLSIDSTSLEKKEAVVLKNTGLKESTKNFAKTLENVKKTQYVTVFETEGKFTKVRTKAGNIGYIQTKKISDPEVLWETMDEEEVKSVTVLGDYSIVDSKYEVLSNVSEDAIVTPNLFQITTQETGEVTVNPVIDLSGTKFTTYKDWANESGVAICGTVTLNGSMSKVCSSYETRSDCINTIYNNLVANELRMVCIDFSEIDDIEGLYRFVTEMVPRFKCAGMKVLVKYNSSLNKDRLNHIVDFVIE